MDQSNHDYPGDMIDASDNNQVSWHHSQVHYLQNTGWPFRLIQTSRWHQSKSCVLIHGPHTKTERLLLSTGCLNQPEWSPCMSTGCRKPSVHEEGCDRTAEGSLWVWSPNCRPSHQDWERKIGKQYKEGARVCASPWCSLGVSQGKSQVGKSK